jgi:hypothetical protein
MRVAALDHAESTSASARVAHEHEGGRSASPAFSHIRAICFLTNSVQIMMPEDFFDFLVLFACRISNAQPFRFLVEVTVFDLQSA